MNRLASLFLFVAFQVAAIDVTWNFQDFTANPLTVKQVKVTPLAPYGTNGSGIVTGDYYVRQTGTNGSLTITNMVASYSYRVEFSGPFVATSFTNSFGAITGAVNAVDYISSTLVSDSGLVAYSKSQSDARFALRSNALFYGSEPKLNGTNFSTLYSGGGGGTTYTNTTDTVGVISGSGIGSNLVSLATVTALTTVSNQTTTASNTIVALLQTNTANLRPAISDRRMTEWETTSGLGLPFTAPGTNSIPLIINTNGISAHGTRLVNLTGTNYVFAVGRFGFPTTLFKINCDTLAYTTLAFTNDARHGYGSPLTGGADTIVYARGKLYIPFNDQSPSQTNLTVAEIDPFTMTTTDVVSTNIAFSLAFNAMGAAATEDKLFVGTGSGNGSAFVVVSLTNYAVLFYTNFNIPPPVSFPGWLHSMHYDGKYVWGAGYINKPGVIRINPTNYTVTVAAITNATGEIPDVPGNDNSGLGIVKPTDDLTSFGNYIYLGTEDTNGIITRVNRETMAVDRVWSGLRNICWGTFALGDYVYAVFGSEQASVTNNGVLVRINPTTLQIDHASVPYLANEVLSDGQTFFVTAFDSQTNYSLIYKMTSLDWVPKSTFWANTNGTMRATLGGTGDFSVSGTFSGNGSGLTNLSLGALPGAVVTNNFAGNLVIAPYGSIYSGLNGFSETNFWGNGSGLYNLNASNIVGTIPSARMGTTNAATNTTTSYSLVMHGTNPPVWANVLSNVTLASGVNVSSGGITNANGLYSGTAFKYVQFGASFVSIGSGGGGGYINVFQSAPVEIGTQPLLVLSGIRSSTTITATNGFISGGNLQPTTNGLGGQGGIIGCNGTNWWTVMRNSGGGLATNKLTLEAWP